MQLGCLIFLLLLFCLLGSTAEDFFSPILTQISQDLGLPPRLAGGGDPSALSPGATWAHWLTCSKSLHDLKAQLCFGGGRGRSYSLGLELMRSMG